MSFSDIIVNTENLYTLGRDMKTGEYYLSIPVSNQMVGYEEYYKISYEDFEEMKEQQQTAIDFADQCRARRNDHLLLLKPGTDRGIPL